MREVAMAAGAETGRSENKKRGAGKRARYDMRLFVAGDEPNSAIAKAALQRICQDYLEGDCRVEIIDVLKDFQPALQENILVTPALIVQREAARTVVFGNLTNVDKVLAALDIETPL
jgi:circadian clock protein KaiB